MPHDLCYVKKPLTYFSGARTSFIDELPLNSKGRLLEVGCGTGDTGLYALEQEKCGWCCGIELNQKAAAEAGTKLHAVIVGDVETIELGLQEEYFDVLILSEVLEHLVSPGAVLNKLYRFLKPGAFVISGSPNVAHYSTVLMLLKGRWDLTSAGIMDGTHLRWFTPVTYRRMFEGCGYVVESIQPAQPLRPKARLFNALTGGRWEYLLHSQIYLRARRPPAV